MGSASSGVANEAWSAAFAMVSLGVVLAVEAITVLRITLRRMAMAFAALTSVPTSNVGITRGAVLKS